MKYQEIVNSIDKLDKFANHTIEDFSDFCEFLGQPQNCYKVVHIAGTNGKGSTANICSKFIQSLGLKVGLYTGPHIFDYLERYKISDINISQDKFCEIAEFLFCKIEEYKKIRTDFKNVSWFEFLTAVGFLWFKFENVDCAVVEVGLGGRLDATNVVNNVLVSVITNISMDHSHILGDTIKKIAAEKAGIIKKNIPVVTACESESLSVIKKVAKINDCQLISVDSLNSLVYGYEFDYAFYYKLFNQNLSLYGLFQISNTMLAFIAFLFVYKSFIGEIQNLQNDLNFVNKTKSILSNLKINGRCEYYKDSNILIDACHNIGGAQAIRETLDTTFKASKKIFIFACYKNKDARGILASLLNSNDKLILCQFVDTRPVYSCDELFDIARNITLDIVKIENFSEALNYAKSIQNKDDLIVVLGSFKLVKLAKMSVNHLTDNSNNSVILSLNNI